MFLYFVKLHILITSLFYSEFHFSIYWWLYSILFISFYFNLHCFKLFSIQELFKSCFDLIYGQNLLKLEEVFSFLVTYKFAYLSFILQQEDYYLAWMYCHAIIHSLKYCYYVHSHRLISNFIVYCLVKCIEHLQNFTKPNWLVFNLPLCNMISLRYYWKYCDFFK